MGIQHFPERDRYIRGAVFVADLLVISRVLAGITLASTLLTHSYRLLLCDVEKRRIKIRKVIVHEVPTL